MTTLTHFFKDSDSNLGVFYPKNYIIATFSTFDQTKQGVLALQKAGFGPNELLAIPGDEIIKFFEEFRAHSGVWSDVMSMLSRGFGTEQVFADEDVERARAGAGFLAVYSPEEAQAARVQSSLAPFNPRAMHWYKPAGIECLI